MLGCRESQETLAKETAYPEGAGATGANSFSQNRFLSQFGN
jgi:hypothetical protein